MRRARSFGILSLTGLLAAGGCAQFARMSPAYLDRVEAPTPLARRLDSAMAALARQGFSGTILVAQGTHMVLYRGYGIADPLTGAPATALTRYPLGAVANQFTAAAVLQLASERQLAVSERASKYDQGVAMGDATLAELLTRSREPIEYARGSGLAGPAAFHERAPLLASPLEEQFRTAGASYSALERVVAAVSGQTFDWFRRERILIPARMDRTIEAAAASPLDQVAVGTSFGREAVVHAQGLVAPLADLYRWHLALEGNAPLGAEAREAMLTPGSNGYAPGWVVGQSPSGATLFQHVGDTEGFQLWTAWLPESDTVILLGINSDIGWRNLASTMLLGLVDGRREGPPSPIASR